MAGLVIAFFAVWGFFWGLSLLRETRVVCATCGYHGMQLRELPPAGESVGAAALGLALSALTGIPNFAAGGMSQLGRRELYCGRCGSTTSKIVPAWGSRFVGLVVACLSGGVIVALWQSCSGR